MKLLESLNLPTVSCSPTV